MPKQQKFDMMCISWFALCKTGLFLYTVILTLHLHYCYVTFTEIWIRWRDVCSLFDVVHICFMDLNFLLVFL